MAVDVTIAFAARLRAGTEITKLVGERIYANRMPQAVAQPCLVFWSISERVWYDLQSNIGMDQATFQVDAYGTTQIEANRLAWETWRHMDGFSGIVGNVMLRDVSRSSGIIHGTDRVTAGSDQYRYIATHEYEVTYYSAREYSA